MENAQKVGPQVLEALCLQWWILLHAISQWWPCSHAPQARGVTDRCVHLTHGWYGLPSTMVGGVNWWNWMEPSTTKATSGFSVILLCTSLGDRRFGRNFVYVQDNAMPHTASDTTAFLAQQYVEVTDWPAWIPDTMSMYGTSLDLRHGWPHFYCARTATCCLRGMGCSSPKMGEDPGGEHAMSWACSTRRQRGPHKVLIVWWHGCKHVWRDLWKMVICYLVFFREAIIWMCCFSTVELP